MSNTPHTRLSYCLLQCRLQPEFGLFVRSRLKQIRRDNSVFNNMDDEQLLAVECDPSGRLIADLVLDRWEEQAGNGVYSSSAC